MCPTSELNAVRLQIEGEAPLCGGLSCSLAQEELQPPLISDVSSKFGIPLGDQGGLGLNTDLI